MYNSSKSCVEQHIEFIGYPVKDKVTGFRGVVSSISFDLYGCVQAAITPPVDKEGKIPEGMWFDVTRLEKTSEERVMEVPDFAKGYIAEGKKGAAEKPSGFGRRL